MKSDIKHSLKHINLQCGLPVHRGKGALNYDCSTVGKGPEVPNGRCKVSLNLNNPPFFFKGCSHIFTELRMIFQRKAAGCKMKKFIEVHKKSLKTFVC